MSISVQFEEVSNAYKELMENRLSVAWNIPPMKLDDFELHGKKIRNLKKIKSAVKKLQIQVDEIHIPKLHMLLDENPDNMRFELEQSIKNHIMETVIKSLLDSDKY